MKIKMPAWGIGFVSLNLAAWMPVAAHPIDEHQQGPDVAAASIAGDSRTALTASDAQALGPVIERALARYFESRGVEFAPSGELAGLIADEIGGLSSPEVSGMPGEKVRYSGGRRLSAGEPVSRGVFVDDVELSLTETGSGAADKVQLVFRTPEFDGDPVFGDAWSIVVDAHDTASADDGRMFFSTPSFVDALQLFTDGSAIVPELRHLTLRKRNSPPTPGGVCGSLQEGQFYWDTDIPALCVCDGSGWKTVDADEMGTCS